MARIGRTFLGGRIAKSFLASLITAYICQTFDWPPLFAVMTSVVSIENTSSDSFKKGLVRFPASAIGAAIAMGLEAYFGESALSYTLAATLTLIVCIRLKLHDGLVVAVLTAVAMLPVTYGNYLDSFVVRLGTTFTGITVATLINYFVLPPNYYTRILERSEKLVKDSAKWLELFFYGELPAKPRLRLAYQSQVKELDTAFKLVHFQRSEWRYHWRGKKKLQLLNQSQRLLEMIQSLQHQLADLIYASCSPRLFKGTDHEILLNYGKELVAAIEQIEKPFSASYLASFETLCSLYEREKEVDAHQNEDHPQLHPRIKLLYDLFDIHDLICDMKKNYHKSIAREEKLSHDEHTISNRGLDR
ncbi:aromatic acid exporter family protein [Pullulanibacillus sp. KACC 23026]|uniref:FUSC family protein n=1 Tax=Pullulanibacillus sp. KACC 23026 TaxID=3028315 RepID=UPI0023AF7413|nr:aromatic acid exporter family protein [Pullulanibacillus sp. KACC 23026]WEG13052.1 aromatic acid exporter family protein [Pullulanibacillus sp. KACC 23026]